MTCCSTESEKFSSAVVASPRLQGYENETFTQLPVCHYIYSAYVRVEDTPESKHRIRIEYGRGYSGNSPRS